MQIDFPYAAMDLRKQKQLVGTEFEQYKIHEEVIAANSLIWQSLVYFSFFSSLHLAENQHKKIADRI